MASLRQAYSFRQAYTADDDYDVGNLGPHDDYTDDITEADVDDAEDAGREWPSHQVGMEIVVENLQ